MIVEARKYNLCADLLIRLGAANITIHPSRPQESIYRLHMSLRPGDGERWKDADCRIRMALGLNV